MKIRTKLTLQYSAITAAVFTIFVGTIYLFSERNREKEFYRDLKKEAVTKANLFLSGRVDAATMHSIYRNNREFINEVEVAVYDTAFRLLYHDALELDLVKETPDMMRQIRDQKSLDFYQDDYQVCGLLYFFNGTPYIVTAAAYDGYGIAKLDALARVLIALWLAGLVMLAVTGYYMARKSLSPVAEIVDEVEAITDSNLDRRLDVKNPGDELGELSETFNRMLDRLEKSFDSQKMFVSNISHELRTPMAALIAELELSLFRERVADEYREVITHALQDARRLERLSDGMLNLARASYDPKQIAFKACRLDEILLDARELVIKANPAYQVELLFEQEPDDDTLITVNGNEYLLRTAFVNLIENNCKFSDNRTSNVQISFYEGQAVIRFSDTGIGIDPEDMEHLFTPFYRGENKQYTQGYGIGMPLVQKIIHLHDGKIQALSHKGEGTVFTVELPHL